MISKVSFTVVLFIFVTFANPSQGEGLLDMINCAGGSYSAVMDCYNKYQSDVEYFGGSFCCIAAKFRYCLSSEEAQACGSGIGSFVDKILGDSLKDQDCRGQSEYPSFQCVFFYYQPYVILALIAAAVTVVCGLCCCCIKLCCNICCNGRKGREYRYY